MAQPLNPKDLVTLEELTISNMWEVAALIEVLEKKGVMTKQDILDAIREAIDAKEHQAMGINRLGERGGR